MPEAADQPSPAGSGRSLAGFYLAVGAAAALLGLGAWLYRPTMARYLAWRVSADASANESRAIRTAAALVRMGPEARIPTQELMRSDRPSVRWCTVAGMYLAVFSRDETPVRGWWVPLAVEAAGDPDAAVSEKALATVEELFDIRFLGAEGRQADLWQADPEERRKARVREMLQWWETTGKRLHAEMGDAGLPRH